MQAHVSTRTRAPRPCKQAMRILDAETLAAQHLMPEDQAIRERDLPERLQLAGVVLNERTVEAEDGTQHVSAPVLCATTLVGPAAQLAGVCR